MLKDVVIIEEQLYKDPPAILRVKKLRVEQLDLDRVWADHHWTKTK